MTAKTKGTACTHPTWQLAAFARIDQAFVVWCPACGALGTAPTHVSYDADGKIQKSDAKPPTWQLPGQTKPAKAAPAKKCKGLRT